MDSYLHIAERVLKEHPVPMGAREILKQAKSMGLVPDHLHGKTQHKTLQARIAEDILQRRERSAFMRTEPGKFTLRSNFDSLEYHSSKRADQLKQFSVLCLAGPLPQNIPTRFVEGEQATYQIFDSYHATFVKLADALESKELGSIILFVFLCSDRGLLVRDCNPSLEERYQVKSLGFVDYVRESDFTLFSESKFGIKEAAKRVVAEALGPHSYSPRVEQESYVSILGLMSPRVDSTNEPITMVVKVCLPKGEDPLRRLGNRRSHAWYSEPFVRHAAPNFDALSRSILENDILKTAFHEQENVSVSRQGRRTNN